jgi:ureidoacrylate peracid hydrolase
VVDLQNGFMAPGQPAEIPTAREIVPNVNRISAALRNGGGYVVYIQNTIDATAKEVWSNWFAHMSGKRREAAMTEAFTPGGFGHSLWPELEVLPGDLKVQKNRFGAFVPGSSNLHSELQARNVDTVIITGTATNVCCESTARDAMMLDFKVVMVEDCCAALSDDEHRSALENIIQQFGDVMTASEALARLRHIDNAG